MPSAFAALLWISGLGMSLLATALAAEPEAGIRGHIERAVEALQNGERVEIQGAPIAARNFLSDLYRRHAFRPLWSAAASVQLIESIRAIEDDGLDPADYHLAKLGSLLAREQDDPELRALTDVLLTDALLRLAYHARFGKLNPQDLDPTWNFTSKLVVSDPIGAVQDVVDKVGIREFIDSLKPQHPLYGKLKAALAQYRAIAKSGGWPSIPAGPTLKQGVKDTRVTVLRRRLAVTGDLEAGPARDPSRFDTGLEKAARAFQERHGLKPDGQVGRITLNALNVPVRVRIDQIRATLERCRWVMHDLPERFVLVNIAGFRAYWIENGVSTWDSAVVVGKPYTRTPTFRADMKYIVLNPTWRVPPSIVRNEILPALRRDPGYLARKHIRYTNGRYVQSAGDHNSLGRIKLMFPNPHSVYLHDTPSKALFNEASRSFSHGCVRVQKPFELAALAIGDPTVTESTLRREIARGKTRTIHLGRPVPVLILYWTASVADDGSLRFLPDIYDRDPAIIRGLNGPLAPLDRSKVIWSSAEP